MNTYQLKTVTLGPVRISRHNLFTPYSHGGNAEDNKYTITVLIPKSDIRVKTAIDNAIEATAQEAILTKWNGIAPVPLITPIHDGDGVRPNGESYGADCVGCYIMTANSKDQPEIVDQNLQPLVNPRDIYRGAWVYVSVTFFSYMRSGKKGIGCALGPVMKFKDDEPLDGRVSAQAAFAGVAQAIAKNDVASF